MLGNGSIAHVGIEVSEVRIVALLIDLLIDYQNYNPPAPQWLLMPVVVRREKIEEKKTNEFLI